MMRHDLKFALWVRRKFYYGRVCDILTVVDLSVDKSENEFVLVCVIASEY